jgi:fatty-acyl-CoA synthase
MRRVSFAETVGRAGKLANAQRRLGVSGDDRVATFQWNNQGHVEACLAVPSMLAPCARGHEVDLSSTCAPET